MLLLASASRKLGEGGPIDTWERSGASRSRGNQDSQGNLSRAVVGHRSPGSVGLSKSATARPGLQSSVERYQF